MCPVSQRLSQIMTDVELADNNAHMLHEAVSFANPELEAVEENELIKVWHNAFLFALR